MFHAGAKKEALRHHKDAVDAYDLCVTEVQSSVEDLYGHRKAVVEETLPAVERLINSIARTPKEFRATSKRIRTTRVEFERTEKFAAEAHKQAVRSGASAGSAIAGGAAVAALAPTAAMAIATTFGVASTGTAISALSGAAATNAALAWLGGGALAAGGGGMAAGNALLALAGPIGWSIAGVSVAGSLFFLDRKNRRVAEDSFAAAQNIRAATTSLERTRQTILSMITETVSLAANVDDLATQLSATVRSAKPGRRGALGLGRRQATDFRSLSADVRLRLGTLVNTANALGALVATTVE